MHLFQRRWYVTLYIIMQIPVKIQELKEVLYDVLDTPVSPELLPPKDGEIAQKTEDLVGPYELHDFFLYYLLRFSYEPSKIYRYRTYAFEGEYDDATIYKWLYTFCRRFFIQQFKRSCLPDGLKVGTVALSPRGDWRMPSDACSEVWLRDLEKVNPEVYRAPENAYIIIFRLYVKVIKNSRSSERGVCLEKRQNNR